MRASKDRNCSCGVPEGHVVAKRKTFDNIDVFFWSDGAVTNRTGSQCVKGRLQAGRIFEFADNVSLITWNELPAEITNFRKRTRNNPLDNAAMRTTLFVGAALALGAGVYLLVKRAKAPTQASEPVPLITPPTTLTT